MQIIISSLSKGAFYDIIARDKIENNIHHPGLLVSFDNSTIEGKSIAQIDDSLYKKLSASSVSLLSQLEVIV